MRKTILAILLASAATHSLASPFCPWKIPSTEAKSERFINLTVVQFIVQNDEELQISYGGGNLGSGHDLRIPTKNRDEGSKLLKSMLDTAKQCDK
ncbi:hypothetical protein HZU75_04630 [Chitinibacter fontanus]|uniref:Uncharacterized protein n=1 Tax=Chitinibacter fontanus TaxID=1737446 RepID=A0A7D5V8P9_9NEIS|nr:hypothetical protein [Chitinibacter fontanus]QLI80871.1 hypothetical protein HZU75_04630 [Chitinibacter fontanus]